MLAHAAAVNPHLAAVIHRAKVEQNAPAGEAAGEELRAGVGKGAAVPEVLGGGEGFLHAGELRFHRVRHQDLTLEGGGGGALDGQDGVIPPAVEVGPARAGHLRAGVFWQGDGLRGGKAGAQGG